MGIIKFVHLKGSMSLKLIILNHMGAVTKDIQFQRSIRLKKITMS